MKAIEFIWNEYFFIGKDKVKREQAFLRKKIIWSLSLMICGYITPNERSTEPVGKILFDNARYALKKIRNFQKPKNKKLTNLSNEDDLEEFENNDLLELIE